jgi:hypothetical protein
MFKFLRSLFSCPPGANVRLGPAPEDEHTIKIPLTEAVTRIISSDSIFRNYMADIMGDVHRCLAEGKDHFTTLHEVTGIYNLYDKEHCAPVWLSRVIEGELTDKENNEGFYA